MKRLTLTSVIIFFAASDNVNAGEAKYSVGAVTAQTTLPSVGHRPVPLFSVDTCVVTVRDYPETDENGSVIPPVYGCAGQNDVGLDEAVLEARALPSQTIRVNPAPTGMGNVYYQDDDGDVIDSTAFMCTWYRVRGDVAEEIKTEPCAGAQYTVLKTDEGYRIRLAARLRSDLKLAQEKGYTPSPAEGLYLTESPEPVKCSSALYCFPLSVNK